MKITDLLSDLPWEELRAAYDAMVDAGERPAAAAKAVALLVDDLVDWSGVVKGPAGVVLEAVDRPLVRLAVSIVLRFSQRGSTG